MKKQIKYPKKKVSTPPPRPQIEILDPKEPPFHLDKTGQYSDYWKKRARNAKEEPPGGRP